MRLFQPNRYFNASYERPILELSVEKCYPIVSGLDRPSKLRLFVNSDLPSNNSTQNQPKTHANQLISGNLCSLLWLALMTFVKLCFLGVWLSRDCHTETCDLLGM